MKNDIKLSVIIISYRQKKYIREAIDSVLMQNVNFKYELLLADDCSQDGTLEIMKEYEKKYPNIIKVLERKENLGATTNILDAGRQSRGKYVTILEGDDYWIDENKLQIQVDFLDEHSDYIGVSHMQQGRDTDNNTLGIYPTWVKEDCTLTFRNFETSKNFSSSTCLYKNIYINKEYQKELEFLLSLHRIVADIQLCYFLLKYGKVYCINKPMMVYRVIKKDGESNYNSTNSILDINYNSLKIVSSIDQKTNYKYNFYKRYLGYMTVGFAFSILNRKFKKFKEYWNICPKKYHLKILIMIPFNGIKILLNRRK